MNHTQADQRMVNLLILLVLQSILREISMLSIRAITALKYFMPTEVLSHNGEAMVTEKDNSTVPKELRQLFYQEQLTYT